MKAVRGWGWGVPLVFLLGFGPRPAVAQDENPRYTNLQVLPADISDRELGNVMLANLQGLGLRRRGGEGCLYCHAGSMDVPRDTWD